MMTEVEGPSLRDLSLSLGLKPPVPPTNLQNTLFVGSGKGALALILHYLRKKQTLEDKTAEVLCADWLGFWVYNQIQQYAFPVKQYSPKTRVLKVYHQYGFPQDMNPIMDFAREKKLLVIEDCAHVLDSSYKNRKLGTFGDFALFSYSKFCFCFALGGVTSQDADFMSFARTEISRSSWIQTAFKDFVKLQYEYWSRRKEGSLARPLKDLSQSLLCMSYSLYPKALKPCPVGKSLFLQKRENEISVRQKRYRFFRGRVDQFGICEHLEAEGVTPYVIPIRGEPSTQSRVLTELTKLGVSTGIYRFDVQRNLLNPKFEPVVWIPCHGGMTDSLFEAVTEAVIRAHR